MAPVVKDLKPVELKGKDIYEKFELSLPFCRMTCMDFFTTLLACYQESGKDGYVTFESLQNNFKSEAWQCLHQADSKATKYFNSEFLLKDGQAGQLDFQCFATMGFLLTEGKPKEKVEVLFNILQEGGLTQHDSISAEDADWGIFWKFACRVATIHVYRGANEISSIECPFEDSFAALEAVIDDEDEDNSLTGQVLDSIYGYDSKVKYEDWSKKIMDKAKWLFTADALRKKVHEKANVEYSL